MDGSAIVGLGCYLPDRVLSSVELAGVLGVTANWIHARTGIRTRHLAHPDETVADLALAAATDAIDHSGLPPSAVGAVVVATCTGQRMPNTASQVAARLGLTCPAFDVNAACAGFCHALAVADGLIRGGAAEVVLVIGADKTSGSLDWCDRNTAPLFGDGAGAVVVRRARAGVGRTVWGSQGEHGALVELSHQTIRQQGPTVFRWAIGLGAKVRDVCDANGVPPEKVAAFVPHQANLRIIDALAAAVDGSTVARDIVDVGNTMAASIPISLARMAQRKELPYDEPIVLFGFGSGLTYAGQVVHIAEPGLGIRP